MQQKESQMLLNELLNEFEKENSSENENSEDFMLHNDYVVIMNNYAPFLCYLLGDTDGMHALTTIFHITF